MISYVSFGGAEGKSASVNWLKVNVPEVALAFAPQLIQQFRFGTSRRQSSLHRISSAQNHLRRR
jgi:hypothetical protein